MTELDEIEKLGIMYEAAVAQQEALQDGIKQMARVVINLRDQPEALKSALQSVTAETVARWMDQAGQEAIKRATATADRAAAEFSSVAKQAATQAQEATEKADKALASYAWWYFMFTFIAGMLCGVICLHVFTPAKHVTCEPSPVNLDPQATAKLLQPALIAECRRR